MATGDPSAPEIRKLVNDKAKKENVSVPRTALNNFVDTYSKTRVGPIHRAIANFFKGIRDDAVRTAKTQQAKNVAAKKAAETKFGPKSKTTKSTTVSDAQKRRQVASAPSRKTTVSDAQKKGQLGKKKAPLLPKSPPKRPKKNTSKTTKKSEKMYHQINVQTGKVDFSKPKVTAAKRLQQEDKYKANKLLNKTAKESLKKKGK